MRSPLKPRPRPAWKSDLSTPQVGPMAEDLLGVSLVAAAGGLGTVGRPRVDKGIDLYLRRLQSMFTVPLQVKASLVVGRDATVTHYVPEADLRALSGGYIAVVHLPSPHDQLYSRVFLIPDEEFRRRCDRVTQHRVPCYRFTAEFAGPTSPTWERFLNDIDRLPEWVTSIPGWTERKPPLGAGTIRERVSRAENHDIAAIGSLWAAEELERVGLGRIVIVEDRVRLDTVTFLVHDLETQQFAGLHLRTAVFNETRRIHFDVKRQHFFIDGQLWVALVLLRPDRRVHDYCLLIPSADIPGLGFSETVTLDPLTKRFQKYLVPSKEFGAKLMHTAFGKTSTKTAVTLNRDLPRAS